MRNSKWGMRNSHFDFRISHYRAYRYSPGHRQELASFHSAAILREPHSRGKAHNRMHFEARIEPLKGKLPKVTYRWDPETDTLTVDKNPSESVFHIRVGRQRAATVVRVADHMLVEVDKQSRIAGLWLLEVPPFPNVEATA